MFKRNKKAFTLLELVIIIAIVTVLSIVLHPVIYKQIDNAKFGRVKKDLDSYIKSVNLFYVDKNRFPTNKEELENYMTRKFAKNPYKGEYIYNGVGDVYLDITNLPQDVKIKLMNELKKNSAIVDENYRYYFKASFLNKTVDELIQEEGYIPLANLDDIKAMDGTTTHTFAQGTQYEVTKEAGTYGLNSKYILVNDIELDSSYTPHSNFTGTLNGNGHKIAGGGALFNNNDGRLINLELEEVNIANQSIIKPSYNKDVLISTVQQKLQGSLKDLYVPTIVNWNSIKSTILNEVQNISNIEFRNYETVYNTPGQYNVEFKITFEDDTQTDWLSENFIVRTAKAEWHGLSPSAYDNDENTFIDIGDEQMMDLTWDGKLEGHPVSIIMQVMKTYGGGILSVQILDENDNILSFYDENNIYRDGYFYGTHIENVISYEKTKYTFIMPKGAKKIRFKNHGGYRNPYYLRVYEVMDYEDKTPPHSVSNLTAIPNATSVMLSWNNPNDEDFEKVAIYRNGEFIAFVSKDTTVYNDHPVDPLTTYQYEIEPIDITGNRGEKNSITVTTHEASLTFTNLTSAVIDGDLNTGMTIPYNQTITSKWSKDISGKTLTIVAQSNIYNAKYATWRKGTILFQDENNVTLSSLTIDVNKGTYNIVVPDNADHMVIKPYWKPGYSGDYADLTIYEISIN